MSYRERRALYHGRCFCCGHEVLPGDRIAMENRKLRHRICVRPVVNTGAWKDSANWSTEHEFRIVREAMAKQDRSQERRAPTS